MSDEQENKEPDSKPWIMPEPIFQSSEGYTPKSALVRDAFGGPSEHETEDALSESTDTIDDLSPPMKDVPDALSSKPQKGRGCANVLISVIGVIAAIILVVLIVLVYFLFWYLPQDNTTF